MPVANNRLRVAIPADWNDETAAKALQALAGHLQAGMISKAIKDPAPSIDRARARNTFLRLQRRFSKQVTSIFESMEEIAQLVRFEQAPPEYLMRGHKRCIAQLNIAFAQSYEEAFRCGLKAAGVTREVADNELAMVRTLRLNENSYAANFLTDIAHGEGKMPLAKRAGMYGNALEEVYWQGFLSADQMSDRYVKWVMPYDKKRSDNEHCPDCAILSGNQDALRVAKISPAQAKKLGAGGRWGNGVYQARELAKLGVVPQSGKLACTTHCHCFLRPAEHPAGKPGKPLPVPFTSQRPKSFTGTERGVKGGVQVTRSAAQARRKRYAQRAAKTDHRYLGKFKKALLRLGSIFRHKGV